MRRGKYRDAPAISAEIATTFTRFANRLADSSTAQLRLGLRFFIKRKEKKHSPSPSHLIEREKEKKEASTRL